MHLVAFAHTRSQAVRTVHNSETGIFALVAGIARDPQLAVNAAKIVSETIEHWGQETADSDLIHPGEALITAHQRLSDHNQTTTETAQATAIVAQLKRAPYAMLMAAGWGSCRGYYHQADRRRLRFLTLDDVEESTSREDSCYLRWAQKRRHQPRLCLVGEQLAYPGRTLGSPEQTIRARVVEQELRAGDRLVLLSPVLGRHHTNADIKNIFMTADDTEEMVDELLVPAAEHDGLLLVEAQR